MTDETARIALAVFDGFAGLLIAVALMSNTLLAVPKAHRFFISLGAAGLLAQSVLTLAWLEGYAVAEFWWTWAGKDLCIGGLAVTYALIDLRAQRV